MPTNAVFGQKQGIVTRKRGGLSGLAKLNPFTRIELAIVLIVSICTGVAIGVITNPAPVVAISRSIGLDSLMSSGPGCRLAGLRQVTFIDGHGDTVVRCGN